MTHPEALAAIRRLAVGLRPDDAGVSRLLERVSVAGDDAEALRDALTLLGAEALLESAVSARELA